MINLKIRLIQNSNSLNRKLAILTRKKLTEWDAGDATGLIIGDGDIPVKKKIFFSSKFGGNFQISFKTYLVVHLVPPIFQHM